jgi:predicted nucleotidyltransferase
MTAVEKNILQRFKELLVERVAVEEVILFGSRARGDAEEFSDADVVVILKDGADGAARDAVSDSAWEAGFEAGLVIVPVVFTREEWERGPERSSLLALAVRAEGVAL